MHFLRSLVGKEVLVQVDEVAGVAVKGLYCFSDPRVKEDAYGGCP